MQNDPINPETPVRHRRSSRYAQGRAENRAPGGPDLPPPPPAVHTSRSASARGERPLPPSRAKSPALRRERLSPLRMAVLFVLVLLCILGAYSLWNSSLKISELRAARAAEEEARRNTVMRHMPAYTDLIETWAGRNGIEPAFVCAVIYRESHFDPQAVSSAGARGLMQLMPDTGTWWAGNLGIRDYTADSLFTPDMNIRLGVRYLRYLSDKFGGDPILVACGYHAGAGNVEGWIKKYSSDGFSLTLEEIPMEDTQTYARRVLESYAIYLQYYYPSGGRT